jgi:hypothetical protein
MILAEPKVVMVVFTDAGTARVIAVMVIPVNREEDYGL